MTETDLPRGTIVVGVDGSESSNRAVDWAIAEAGREHRAITVVHGIGTDHSLWMEPGVDWAAITDAMHASAEELVAQARQRVQAADPRLDVRELVTRIDARQALLDLGENAAMVVVGSRGRGPLKSLLLGSVSLAVSRHSHVPVVVVRPGQDLSASGVAVATGSSAEGNKVVEYAFEAASMRGEPLYAYRAVWDELVERLEWRPDKGEPDLEPEREMLSEALAGMREKFPDVEVILQLGRGLIADALVRDSAQRSLVVVGSTQPDLLSRIAMGDPGTEVVQHAHCPVAIIRVQEPTD